MKKYLALLLLSGLFAFAKNNRQSHTCTTKTGKFSYETKDGRIDGKYVSYYTNGKKKAEGTFSNNYRYGTWTIWDSTGAVQLKREYSSPFTFKQTYPVKETDHAVKQPGLQKNAEGFYSHSLLNEKEITWAKRVWRMIEPANNTELFRDNRLFRVLHKNILDNKLAIYSAEKDDDFRTKLAAPGDTAAFRVIGYRIKEDAFFDHERLLSETRIIGICPVAVDKKTGDTTNLYWVFMPDARKLLAAEQVNSKSAPAAVQTLDDLFYFRCFSGMIYKETNIYDRTIASYTPKSERAAEAERIEMEMIDTEHDLWLRFKQ